ncbi:hypothetical protein [Paenibacillus eucommiae]|uniref:Uncharacterized protein n=1 Tax=Paenibacillus eucommiae TaxID=1355755 RepID=A0ABS4J5M0_9BACL|nr:hypothetical protein [Paenibacillus eucommiae]MBP1995083.1 hypothetical protein [Paenibacillus eucommiae]
MERLLELFLLCIVLTLGNIDEKTDPWPPVIAVEAPKPSELSNLVLKDEWEAINKSINDHRQKIEAQHSIQIQSMGVGQDHILIVIRSFGDVERVMSETELAAVEKTLFELANAKFPLKLSVQKCCTRKADITGKISDYDKARNRILIVDEREKEADTDAPEAAWVKLTADGILMVGGKRAASGFDKSLIGREASAWSTGFMALSYPGQASVLKVVVE